MSLIITNTKMNKEKLKTMGKIFIKWFIMIISWSSSKIIKLLLNSKLILMVKWVIIKILSGWI